jgi:DNA-directed RNA polymerase subunit beta'
VVENLSERLRGRTASGRHRPPGNRRSAGRKGQDDRRRCRQNIEAAGIKRVGLRSVLQCESRQGVCATCYGRDLATGKLVEIGVAVGIIAAQSLASRARS